MQFVFKHRLSEVVGKKIHMSKHPCCHRNRVYVAGPLFNEAERRQQADIAKALESAGYCTFLPQRDGYAITDVIANLERKGVSEKDARSQATNIIFDFDVQQLRNSDAVVVDANGVEPDSGSMVETGMAYMLGIPVVIYYNDVRAFSSDVDLNPLLQGVTRVPIAKSVKDVPCLVTRAISKAKSGPAKCKR